MYSGRAVAAALRPFQGQRSGAGRLRVRKHLLHQLRKALRLVRTAPHGRGDPLRPDGGDGHSSLAFSAFRRETQNSRDVGHRRRQGGTPTRHLRDARIGRHAPISRRQLDNAPHLRNRRPGLAQGRRALRLPFDDRRLPRKIQSRRLRIPCRRPDVRHPQQGWGRFRNEKRPAVRQFPHQQRHHGRQFGKLLCSTPGAT